jgi:hypothetical protein
MSDILTTMTGGAFVLVYAWHRITNPSANRASTTAVRYYTAAVAYCLWALVLYAALVTALTVSPDIVRTFFDASGTGLDPIIGQLQSRGLSYALVVALLLTTLLPNIPAIAYVDRRVRELLEHMAAIPYEVRRLVAELERSDSAYSGVTFRMSEVMLKRVRQRLLERGFLREEIAFEGRDLRALWTKVSALLLHLGDWRSDRKFSGFCEGCADKPDEILQAYDELMPRVRRCLRSIQALDPDTRDRQHGGALSEYQAEVERQVQTFLGRIYRFIAAATLHCELTQEDRSARLVGLGFQFRSPWRPSPLLLGHRLVALFTGLFVVLLVILVVAPHVDRHMPANYSRALGLSIMVPLTYVVAVFWAIFLKDRLVRVTRPREGTRPFLSYLLAGLLAMASNAPISLTWVHVVGASTRNVKIDLIKSLVWLMLSFTTAFMTSLLIDDKPRSLPRRWLGRWSEGALQSAATAATAFLVFQVLEQRGYPPRTPIEVMVPLAGLIGLIIGTLIPTWYREAPRRREHLEPVKMSSLTQHRRLHRGIRGLVAKRHPAPVAPPGAA